MNGKLVLTGTTNNPGRVLVECLAEEQRLVSSLFPDGVAAVFRASSNTEHFRACLPEADVITCDLTDTNGLKSAFRDADTVFHLAGIHWTREVVSAAAFCKVRRLIVIHTCGIYSKYKAAGEAYREIDRFAEDTCKKHNIRLTILRPTMIYGNAKDRNMIQFIRMVDQLPVMPVVNGGGYALQPIHYVDLGKACFSVLVNEKGTANRAFILSGEKPITLKEIFSEIGQCLGKQVRFVNCPYCIAYPGAAAIYGLTFGIIDYREKVQRLCEPRAYGHEEATQAFGFSPRPFAEGIKEEVREYRTRK